MTVPTPSRRPAARDRKQGGRQKRPPAETRHRQQMVRSISTRVSRDTREHHRRDREHDRPKPPRSDARSRANRRDLDAKKPELRDQSDLDARAPVLVHEEQEPTGRTAARSRNTGWRTAERHVKRQNETQPGGRDHGAKRRSDQKDPNGTAETRAIKEERSVDSGRGSSCRDADRSRTGGPHRRDRVVHTACPLRAID